LTSARPSHKSSRARLNQGPSTVPGESVQSLGVASSRSRDFHPQRRLRRCRVIQSIDLAISSRPSGGPGLDRSDCGLPSQACAPCQRSRFSHSISIRGRVLQKRIITLASFLPKSLCRRLAPFLFSPAGSGFQVQDSFESCQRPGRPTTTTAAGPP
jgi:hypothetical protein